MRIQTSKMLCDRCGRETADQIELFAWKKLQSPLRFGHKEWDLCKLCWMEFHGFLAAPKDTTTQTPDTLAKIVRVLLAYGVVEDNIVDIMADFQHEGLVFFERAKE